MNKNKYIVKSLAPWMIDELIAISKICPFDLVLLRKQDDFYQDSLKLLISNGVKIYVKPWSINNIYRKFKVVYKFGLSNINKFQFNYNGVIGLKSIWWFLLMDLKVFSKGSNLHAQFATQAALLALLLKNYYSIEKDFKYSFTFHAYDIFFDNAWFDLLVNESSKSFSISEYNIKYVNNKYLISDKIVLSRLGVFMTNDMNKPKSESINAPLVLGFLSWFVEKKGVFFLLKAVVELVHKDGLDIKLLLAGDGPLKEQILNFIEVNRLSNNVNYIGKIKGEDKLSFYKSIDLFVLPSISLENDQDGIPVVLMEAVSYTLPIISTNISGIPEICKNDFNGILINEKSTVELVEAVKSIYNDRKRIDIYSRNSQELRNTFNIEDNSEFKVKEMGWDFY